MDPLFNYTPPMRGQLAMATDTEDEMSERYTEQHPAPLRQVMDTPHGEEDFYWRPWMEYGKVQMDYHGRIVERWATCETCGREWNEAYITGRTPAPSARCPFEDEHEYEEAQS